MSILPILAYLFTALGAYLFGSIPFGFLIARTRGVDIRTVGSRNIGATNVFRSVGKPLGILTFLLDVGKGLGGATLIPLGVRLLLDVDPVAHGLPLAVVGGAMAVVGHNWTVFLGFRGGKGAATGIGVLLGLAWQAAVLAMGIWIVVFLALGYVSLATIGAALGIPPLAWLLYYEGTAASALLPTVLTGLGVITVLRHRANIRRLWNGTEPRMLKRPSPRQPPRDIDPEENPGA